ncbi:hypothetical protein JM946_23455 [Steroidobacter sp. S1-65]|uniref:DNA-binding protein n=1 Tax=Steroidobacter gossypii TaxID=2805490 RepID=A0ABS1X3D8_9GAMM|nr:hypothetical protein [Steroidobacter gossypii]MBM0107712.1 hypothetical protein [Steroidobacter gossypii]
MTVARNTGRVVASTIAPLIVNVRGYKTIKDSDLAALFGISLTKFYGKVGRKLWRLQPAAFFKISKAHDRGRLDRRPVLAFTQVGVMLVAGILGSDDALELGIDIARAMKTRRRTSPRNKRPSKRSSDASKAERYYEARAHMMQGRLHELLKKMRRH